MHTRHHVRTSRSHILVNMLTHAQTEEASGVTATTFAQYLWTLGFKTLADKIMHL
jgi:hypothetical protein